MSSDSANLERFVEAQSGGVYDAALNELRAGRKVSHWMRFVFAQAVGLGHSQMSQRYAIASRHEARRYLAHPVLGPRLVECAHAVLTHPRRSARQIMGTPDDMKLCSSMTLFALVADSEPVFQQVLDTYFAGEHDPQTLQHVNS